MLAIGAVSLAAVAGCGGSSGLGESEYDQCLTWMRGVARGSEQVSEQQRRPLVEAGFEPGRWPRGTVPTEPPVAVCQYAYVWDRVGEDGKLSGATLAAIAVCSMEREGCAHPDLVRRVRADPRFQALGDSARSVLAAVARDDVDIAGTFDPRPGNAAFEAAVEAAQSSGLLRRGPWRQLAVGDAACESGPDCAIVYQFDPRLVPGIERLHEEFT